MATAPFLSGVKIMTDLKKGIIEIDGFTIKPGITLKEMQDFFGDKVRIVNLSIGPRLKLQNPFYLTKNIYAYNFDFNKNGVLSSFSLIPEVPSTVLDYGQGERAKYQLSKSKKWLKEMITDTANDCDDGISYSFEWGYIVSLILQDRDYGLRGGEITIKFRED